MVECLNLAVFGATNEMNGAQVGTARYTVFVCQFLSGTWAPCSFNNGGLSSQTLSDQLVIPYLVGRK